MKTQLDYHKHLLHLQQTIDTSTQLLNTLMHPSKPHRPLKELVAESASAAFVTSKELDNDPPTE